MDHLWCDYITKFSQNKPRLLSSLWGYLYRLQEKDFGQNILWINLCYYWVGTYWELGGTNWEHNDPKCYHVVNWFSLPKPGFLEFIWIFSCRNHLKIKYLPYSESKAYQINSIKSSYQDLSNNTKVTFEFLWNFQLQFNLI